MAAFLTITYSKYARRDVLLLNISYEHNEVVKQIDGKSWSREHKAWMFPVHPNHIEKIRLMLNLYNINLIEGPPVQVYLNELQEKQKIAASIALSEDATIENLLWADKLRNYQRVGIKFAIQAINDCQGCLIADDPGLGKTLQAISVSQLYPTNKGILVLCPTGARHGWGEELSRWTNDSYAIIQGKNKQKRLAEDSMYKIMNYGTATHYKDILLNQEWSTLILDEAHVIKNKATQLFAFVKELKADRKIFLTANAMMNHVYDLWAILNLLHPSKYSNYWAFVNDYCEIQRNNFGSKPTRTNPYMVTSLQKDLSTIMIRREKKDVLTELPSKIYQSSTIELTTPHRKLYNELITERRINLMTAVDITTDLSQFSFDPTATKKTLIVCTPEQYRSYKNAYKDVMCFVDGQNYMDLSREIFKFRLSKHKYALTAYSNLEHIDAAVFSRGNITVGTVLQRTTRERQMLVSPQMIDSSLPDYSPKFDQIIKDLPDMIDGGRKAIIMSQWTRTFDLLAPKLDKAKIKYLEFSGRQSSSKNDAAKVSFVEDDVHPVLLLSTIAGGVALNLQRASIGFRTDKLYNPFLDMQAEDRMHRMGQKDTVVIHDMIIENSIEDDIEIRLKEKKDDFELVMDMKDVLELLRNR